MLWKIRCFTFQTMERTNHKFPIDTTRNVQTQLKSTVPQTSIFRGGGLCTVPVVSEEAHFQLLTHHRCQNLVGTCQEMSALKSYQVKHMQLIQRGEARNPPPPPTSIGKANVQHV